MISLDCFTTSASIVDPGYASKAVNQNMKEPYILCLKTEHTHHLKNSLAKTLGSVSYQATKSL